MITKPPVNELVRIIDETQDGAPLAKRLNKDGSIDYHSFDDYGGTFTSGSDASKLSFSEAIDLLILKAIEQDDPEDCLRYAHHQIYRASNAVSALYNA